ncbi:hypothetical protein D3C75_820930 [compost metagenome]
MSHRNIIQELCQPGREFVFVEQKDFIYLVRVHVIAGHFIEGNASAHHDDFLALLVFREQHVIVKNLLYNHLLSPPCHIVCTKKA